MKKIIFVLFTVLALTKVQSQTEKQNEFKLNAFNLIALKAIDITYERILNEESAIGTSLFISGSSDNSADGLKDYRIFSLTPYYRNYFSTEYAKGFFVEAFAMVHSSYDYTYEDYNSYDYSYNYNKETNARFALGIAVGGKWVTKKGFLVEISGGIGRNLFTNDNNETEGAPVVGRGGISIGRRF